MFSVGDILKLINSKNRVLFCLLASFFIYVLIPLGWIRNRLDISFPPLVVEAILFFVILCSCMVLAAFLVFLKTKYLKIWNEFNKRKRKKKIAQERERTLIESLDSIYHALSEDDIRVLIVLVPSAREIDLKLAYHLQMNGFIKVAYRGRENNIYEIEDFLIEPVLRNNREIVSERLERLGFDLDSIKTILTKNKNGSFSLRKEFSRMGSDNAEMLMGLVKENMLCKDMDNPGALLLDPKLHICLIDLEESLD